MNQEIKFRTRLACVRVKSDYGCNGAANSVQQWRGAVYVSVKKTYNSVLQVGRKQQRNEVLYPINAHHK